MALHEHMLRLLRSFLLSSSLLLGVLLASGQAQITTIITPDRTLGTAVTQSGTLYNIMGGTRPGNGPNLFHSFDRFTVGTNDTASFSGPTGVVNILSRVTGGQQSLIDGQLQSTIPGANLYLLNPSGVVFGPRASLDIKGSFHVSTADFLRFADGATFSAHVGQNSTLTVAPPSAFGFLHSNPAGIAIVGSSLQVAEGKTMSVVGGDIEIVGGVLTSPQAPSLGAPSGRINIVSVASSGEVGLSLSGQIPQLDMGTFERLGEIQITQGAFLDTSGNGGGTTVIRGGQLLIDNGFIAANNLGNVDSPGLGVDVRIRGDIRLTGEAAITSATGLFSRGRGGHISLVADNITIEGSAGLSSTTGGLGPGGDIAVMAPTGTISLNTGGSVGGGGILANSLVISSGSIGEIKVEAGKLLLTNGATIGSLGRGSGKSGNVTISARESVTISGGNSQGAPSGIGSFTTGEPGSLSLYAPVITIDGGVVGAAAVLPGQRAGDITVKADQQLTLVNGAQINSATLTDSKGGNITIEVGQLTLTGGAQINSSTSGRGMGGSIMVTATDTLTLAGTSSTGRLSGIFANAQGQGSSAGAAGSVVVSAPRILLRDGAQIISSTFGPGAGGSVQVTATDTLTLAGVSPDERFASGILATTEGNNTGAGAAGNIMVSAPRIMITDGAAIDGSSFGPGTGGSVTVTAADALTLTGTSPAGRFSGIVARAFGAGTAGSIMVSAPHILVSDGAAISGSTFGPGAGGSVQVTATDTLTLAGTPSTGRLSSISATTEGTTLDAGAAGSIVVSAPHILVRDGAQINSGTSGAGAGGSVIVTASDTLTLAGTSSTGRLSGIFANAQGQGSSAGAAGSIVVSAPHILVRDGAQIISGTFGPGAGGSVQVTASDTLTLAGVAPNDRFASGIFANAEGQGSSAGAAGSIVVSAPRILVRDGAQIISSTFGPGAGGSVQVTASDTLTLAGVAPNDRFASGIFATTEGTAVGAGAAGSIMVSAPHILVSAGATISGSTFGPGAGGSVLVTASDALTLTGTSPGGRLSGIVARAFGVGAAGSIMVSAPHILVSAGAAISGSTFGPGAGGSVLVTASDTLTLAGTSPTGRLSGISATTAGTTVDAGAAGSIVVSAPRILVSDGAQISSSSFGPGAGGSVIVTATDSINITSQESGLSASTAGQGRGGDVLLQARQVQLTDGATISAESTGPGNAGNVTIVAGDTFQSTNSRVVTRATQADGGNVQITATTLVRLRDSAITAEVGGGRQTVGGNITIDPQFVLLQNSRIVANAFEGQGGNIRIQAQRAFLADPASIVDASSRLGIDGIVNIQAPVASISGAIAPLPQEFAPITELLRDRCVGRLREGRVSRFLIGGRDGIPSEPGSLLLSPLMQTDPREDGEPAGTPARTGQVQERAWPVRAGILAGLDVECARWTGQKGPTVRSKR